MMSNTRIIARYTWKSKVEAVILYNVTVKIEPAIAADWLQWIKSEHIPDIIGTGCFLEAKVLHLLETDEKDGITFAVQYYAQDMVSYQLYIDNHAVSMRNKAFEKWGDRFVAFRSVLETLE
jgi:hypothetical protein